MCGIAGFIGNAPVAEDDRQRLAAALKLIAHRGPDDERMESGKDWLFGFRRLSILDLSDSGRQPMWTSDGGAIQVFNGEIYNYIELRELLESGTNLRSTGDAAVLINLLRERGSNALPLLNGMFAFSFLDLHKRTFILARDRLGVKPLYYAFRSSRLFFASELAPLIHMLGSRPEISRLALNYYITFGHIPPPMTIYEGVHKLQPGHVMTGSMDNVSAASIKEWWWLSNDVDYGRKDSDWLEEIEALLQNAVKIRLRSDVPVGVFLSGGIDSGLVAHYTARQTGGKKPIALTVTFDEKEFSEEEIAKEVASAEGLEHILIPVKPSDLKDLPRIMEICGEPFDDDSILNQYHLSRVARQHATVFLSGDAGDESFGGYREYLRVAFNDFRLRLASKVICRCLPLFDSVFPRDTLSSVRLWRFSAKGERFGALVRQNFRDPWINELLRDEARVTIQEFEASLWKEWERSEGLPLVSRMQRFDLRFYLESDVLTKVDRASMAHSIEVRGPFLDYRIVELAARIPAAQHYDKPNARGKRLLRALAEKRLPSNVYAKPKRGFALPISEWIQGSLAAPLEDLITGPNSFLHDWIGMPALKRLFRANTDPSRRAFGAFNYLWRLMVLEVWFRSAVKGEREFPL